MHIILFQKTCSAPGMENTRSAVMVRFSKAAYPSGTAQHVMLSCIITCNEGVQCHVSMDRFHHSGIEPELSVAVQAAQPAVA